MNELPLNQVVCGDCLEVMKTFPDNCVDAIVCDPPAGISFMGRSFDSNRGGRAQWVTWLTEVMSEALRCLKPGGHAFVWALPRTSHWTACALEDAGFEIRDCVTHLFSSGFPKSHNVSKAIDAHLGAERPVIGSIHTKDIRRNVAKDRQLGIEHNQGKWAAGAPTTYIDHPITEAATPEAQQWDGWGSALKPASEHWWLCRKPLSESSIATNVLTWGTGGINIDGCRIGTANDMNPRDFDDMRRKAPKFSGILNGGKEGQYRSRSGTVPDGRWPANVVFSHSIFCTDEECAPGCVVVGLNEQSGMSTSKASQINREESHTNTYGWAKGGIWKSGKHFEDAGGASRFYHCFPADPYQYPFFYTAKAGRSERNRGIPKKVTGSLFEELEDGLDDGPVPPYGAMKGTPEHGTKYDTPEQNTHPTVKSQPLMRHLVKLITPPNGIVLDCFCGSGSTGVAAISEGMRFIGIEMNDTEAEPYVTIARNRIAHAIQQQKRLIVKPPVEDEEHTA